MYKEFFVEKYKGITSFTTTKDYRQQDHFDATTEEAEAAHLEATQQDNKDTRA